jgi:hypothetical protein
MTTYDNEVDLDDTYENVMDNTHLDNTTLLSSPNDQTKNDITLMSLGGMMSTSCANIDETFVIGCRSLEGTSPSVMTRMLMANLMEGVMVIIVAMVVVVVAWGAGVEEVIEEVVIYVYLGGGMRCWS